MIDPDRYFTEMTVKAPFFKNEHPLWRQVEGDAIKLKNVYSLFGVQTLSDWPAQTPMFSWVMFQWRLLLQLTLPGIKVCELRPWFSSFIVSPSRRPMKSASSLETRRHCEKKLSGILLKNERNRLRRFLEIYILTLHAFLIENAPMLITHSSDMRLHNFPMR